MNMKSIKYIHALIVASALLSGSCSALSGLMGGDDGGDDLSEDSSADFVGLVASASRHDLLATKQSASANRLGYVARSSASKDPNADASYLYGIFQPKK